MATKDDASAVALPASAVAAAARAVKKQAEFISLCATGGVGDSTTPAHTCNLIARLVTAIHVDVNVRTCHEDQTLALTQVIVHPTPESRDLHVQFGLVDARALENEHGLKTGITEQWCTALMYAAAGGHTEVVRRLMALHADPFITIPVYEFKAETKGEYREKTHSPGYVTAHDIAAINGHEETAAIIPRAPPSLCRSCGTNCAIQ